MKITNLPPTTGDITYNNVSFDELEIKWKAKPAGPESSKFTALSAWLPDNSEAIPAGTSKVSWTTSTLVGPVPMTVEGSTITLPAGYAYRLRSDLAINKPVADETNVFYSVDSQWIVTNEGVDNPTGAPGSNSCAGTGAQEVRNRASLPAVAYIEAISETTISLGITHSDQALHLAKGSQIHIEVLGTVDVGEKKTQPKTVTPPEPVKATETVSAGKPRFPWQAK